MAATRSYLRPSFFNLVLRSPAVVPAGASFVALNVGKVEVLLSPLKFHSNSTELVVGLSLEWLYLYNFTVF